MLLYAIFIAVFLLMVILLQLMFIAIFRERWIVSQRLSMITQREQQDDPDEPAELKRSFSERLLQPLISGLSRVMGRFTRQEVKKQVAQRLSQAGHPWGLEAHEWVAWRTLMTIGPALAGILIAIMLPGQRMRLALMVPVWGIGGYLLSEYYLTSLIKQRRDQVQRSLPDVLDLLTVSVEAGLGFDSAMLKVVEKMPGVLAQEFQRVAQEVSIGKSRRESLKDMAARTGVADLNSFVSALVQAEQLGTSMGKVLRVQSKDMRYKRRQRAEEQAMKAPIKILFPLILFIFPTLFLVLLGPAFLKFLDAFK